MNGPFAGTRVLLVDVENDPTGHAALRKRALERLGCVVVTCDPKQKQGLIARWRGGSAQDRLGRAVLQHQAQLVLVVQGGELTAGMISSLKRDADAVWAAWFIGETRSLPLMEALSAAYDVLFVPGTDLVAQLRGPSRPPTIHLPPGCDPSVHRPMRARDQFRSNVVFVGAATPRREQLLGELTGVGLAIWGTGWRRTPLKDYCRGEMLDFDDYVRAYAGASVAVNVHREGSSNGGTATGCNQRLFELAAIGVPQVVDNRADLPLAFDTGRELLTFDTGSDLRQLVQELLNDPTTAERLAQAGRRRALAEHTYMHRLGAILGATKR
jgi:spore maturation protein CgeB